MSSNLNVVPIEKVDPSMLSLGTTVKNKHGGYSTPVLYDGKKNLMIPINRKMHVPFGIQGKRSKTPDPAYGSNNFQNGCEMILSFPKDTYEQDPVYQKFQELDQRFIQLINEHNWPEEPSLAAESVRALTGKDDKGRLGKWKRLVKWPAYKNDKDELVYRTEYPPNLQVKVPCETSTKEVDGFKEDTADFTATGIQFYNEDNEELTEMTSDKLFEVLPPHSDAKPVLRLPSVYYASFGFTVKPVLKQMKIYRKAQFTQPTSFLGEEDELTEADAPTESAPTASKEADDEPADESDDEFQAVESDDETEEPAPPKGKTVQRKS